MKDPNKKFDCVEMKHKAAEKIRKATRGMTREQELAYWAGGTEELLSREKSLRESGRRVRPERKKSRLRAS